MSENAHVRMRWVKRRTCGAESGGWRGVKEGDALTQITPFTPKGFQCIVKGGSLNYPGRVPRFLALSVDRDHAVLK